MSNNRFIVSAGAFAKALALVAPALVTNPVVPILENVKLECERVSAGYELVLTCSDLETTLQSRVAVEATGEWWLCVPAKKLLDTLRALPEQSLTCSADTDSYRFEVTAERSHYVLIGENATDFPRRPVVKNSQPIAVRADVLRAAIAATAPTTSTDTLRPSLCGIFFEVSGGELVALASTDGHRMHQYNLLTGASSTGFIVPPKAAGLLLPMLEASGEEYVRLLTADGNIALADGRWDARLIDDNYPPYRNIIPISQPNVAVIDRDALAQALRRLDRYSESKYRAVLLEFSLDTLVIKADNVLIGDEGTETLACTYAGEDLRICFNVPYVLAQLRALPPGFVRLGMSTPNRAWVVTADADGEAPKVLTLCMTVAPAVFA